MRQYRYWTETRLCLWMLLMIPSALASAEQPRFYLSTERIFSPKEKDIHIHLEARGLPFVDFRLYRIEDAQQFFMKQEDLHRVEVVNAAKRENSLDVLQELWRGSVENALKLAKESLSTDARVKGREAFPDTVESIKTTAGSNPEPIVTVPLLKDFPLIDYWREEIPTDSPEWAYREVALTAKKSGAYLVEGVYGHEVGYTVVILSSITLLTRQSSDQLLVYAADMDLGIPVADVSIEVLNGGQTLGKGQTDEDGIWSKEIPLIRNLTIYARHNEDFTLVDPSYHPANLFTKKVYLTTERPVYRPGQEVFFKGIIRSYEDEQYRIDSQVSKVEVSVRDPNGQEIYAEDLTPQKSGSFNGRFELFENATVGTYQIAAMVNGKEYAGEFRVKEYRKPEYKVEISTPKRAYVSGEEVQITAKANYFFGPPVTQAKVKVSVYRTRFYVPWWVDAEYSWYYSDAEYRSTMRETIEEKEGNLDKNGTFSFSFKTLPDSLDYSYVFEAVVTDSAKNAVTGHGSIRVTQAKFRIELVPDFLVFSPGQEAKIKVQTTDYDKKPIGAEVSVSIGGQLGSEPSLKVSEESLQKTVSTGTAGIAEVIFKPSKGGAYTVVAKAKDAQGVSIEEKTTIYVTSSGGDIPFAPEELEIIADRRSYKEGDHARFLFLVPHPNTHLLVTVEGGKLYRHEVIQARGYSTLFETEIGQAQTPNFLVRVASIFDHVLYERQLDVVVPPKEKLLTIQVQTNKEKAQPGESITFQVDVKDSTGKPVKGAEVALGIVDEAIYGISPEIAVPISKFFYHRKRNNVRSICSLDFRFYGYGQDTKDKMAAIEFRAPVVPGSFKSVASMEVRKKFQDTLSWFPALQTDGAGKAMVTVKMPDNLTSWRGTARVITSDTKVGEGTGEIQVTKPVVVRLASPAFLVERDLATFGLLVHNYTNQDQTFRVSLEAKGTEIKLEGAPKDLTIASNGVGTTSWKVHALSPGSVTMLAKATSNTFSDAVEQSIQIRAYGVEQVLMSGGVLDDEHPEGLIQLDVPESAAPHTIKSDVTLSTGVAPALLASLDYLTGYPYGCTEQTMSRFLPDLVVARALKDLGMKNPKLEEELPKYIHYGLAHLSQLQHEDGGWGWWMDDATDAFMTAYVIQGLSMAKRLGWPVADDMLNRGSERLKALVQLPELSPNQRAFLLYGLALAGVKYNSMLEKLDEKPSQLSEYGKALLSLALYELGQRERALAMAGQIDLAVHQSANGAWWGQNNGRLGWEEDPVETTAAALRALILIKPDSINIGQAVRWLMTIREKDHWTSTRDTALAVYALVDYLKKFGGQEYSANVKVALNGKSLPSVHVGAEDIYKTSIHLAKEITAQSGTNRIELSREGKGVLFYNASVRFFSREKDIPAAGRKFQVSRKLYSLKKVRSGDDWQFSIQPLLTSAQTGDEILVVLELEASEDADYIMVEDPLAAGVQPIEQDNGYRIPGVELRQPRMHREFHDQHTAFFLSQLRKGTRQLAYLVRATLPGEYQMMPARILPMYDPQFAGNSENQRLLVKE